MKTKRISVLLVFVLLLIGIQYSGQKKIVYSSNEEGNYDIYVIVLDEYLNIIEKEKLTDWPDYDHWPYWSPDGKQIAYGSYRNGSRQLFIMNEDGSGKKQITNNPRNSTPRAWSLDKKFIYGNHSFPGGGDIAKFDLVNKTIEMITYVPGMNTQNFGLNANQSRIVYVRGRVGNGWTNKMYVADFRIEDYDFSNSTELTEAIPAPHAPKYSPNQKKIAFITMSSSPDNDSLAIINPDGSGFTELIKFGKKLAAFPEWLNNNQIILSLGSKNNLKLHVYDLSNNSLTQITYENGNHVHPSAKDYYGYKVDIDIHPGSEENPINIRSKGNTPVVIFGTLIFDVTSIEPESLLLAGAGLKKVGKNRLLYSFEDVNKDGFLDMVAHFITEDLELTINDTEAVLKGKYGNNKSFWGSDVVKIIE